MAIVLIKILNLRWLVIAYVLFLAKFLVNPMRPTLLMHVKFIFKNPTYIKLIATYYTWFISVIDRYVCAVLMQRIFWFWAIRTSEIPDIKQFTYNAQNHSDRLFRKNLLNSRHILLHHYEKIRSRFKSFIKTMYVLTLIVNKIAH